MNFDALVEILQRIVPSIPYVDSRRLALARPSEAHLLVDSRLNSDNCPTSLVSANILKKGLTDVTS